MLWFRMFTDKNLFEFDNGLTITYYACCILIGVILAIYMAVREMRVIGVPKTPIVDGAIVCVVLSIIGARLYYVACAPEQFDGIADIIGLNGGLAGLSITGGVIVAVIFVIVYTLVRKLDTFKVFDLMAPGLLIGQICGRWGNFFNQEAHGGAMSEKAYNVLSKLIFPFIMKRMYFYDPDLGEKAHWHPTFLYEGLWNSLGLIIMLVARRKFKKLRSGDLVGFYLVWYGIGRACLIEPFRTDPLYFGKVKANILVPLIFAVIGIIYLIIRHTIWKGKYYSEIIEEVRENRVDSIIFKTTDVFLNMNSLLRNAYYYSLYDNTVNVSDEELDALIEKGYKEVFKENPEKLKIFNEYLISHMDEAQKIHGDATEVFSLLYKRDYKFAYVSEFDKEVSVAILEKLGLLKWVSILVTADLEDNSIEYAKNALNGKNYMMFLENEDDCKECNRLGIRPCLVTGTKHYEAATEENPKYIITKFTEILDLLYE